jgi:hypothetical protein
METNKFGERLGEVFGTVCWLWVFHRFSQDGKVLLGIEHPWEHGGGHGHDSHGHGPSHGHHGKEKKLSPDELSGEWEKFTEKATRPGDDDDDDEEVGGILQEWVVQHFFLCATLTVSPCFCKIYFLSTRRRTMTNKQ